MDLNTFWKLRNLSSPASGDPVIGPTQDMVLGPVFRVCINFVAETLIFQVILSFFIGVPSVPLCCCFQCQVVLHDFTCLRIWATRGRGKLHRSWDAKKPKSPSPKYSFLCCRFSCFHMFPCFCIWSQSEIMPSYPAYGRSLRKSCGFCSPLWHPFCHYTVYLNTYSRRDSDIFGHTYITVRCSTVHYGTVH